MCDSRLLSVRERTAPRCVAAVLQWLSGVEETDRIFLWVHLQDPHGPYTPPDDLVSRFEPSERGTPLATCGDGVNSGHGCIPWYQEIGEEHDFNRYVGRYDGEIAYADRSIGRLIDGLRARGRYENAVILLTSDHGEALGEADRYFCHGHGVTRDQSHVPLILKHPATVAGASVDLPVGHIDIFRTLVSVVGGGGETCDPSNVDLTRIGNAPDRSERTLYCDVGNLLGVYVGEQLLVGGLKGRGAEEITQLRPDDFTPVSLSTVSEGRLEPGIDPEARAALVEEAANYLRRAPAEFASIALHPRLRSQLEALGYVEEK